MDDLLIQGSRALKTINIDLNYPGVDINVDFLHINCLKPLESFDLHAHPNFELHYIAKGKGNVGFLETSCFDPEDIFEIPAVVSSIRSPSLTEYHLRHEKELEILDLTKTYELKEGDAFLNPPGQFCWHDSSEHDPITEYGMRFSFAVKKTETPVNVNFIKEYKIIHKLLHNYPIQVTHGNSEIGKIFETVFREAYHRYPGFVTRIKNELLNLIITMARQSPRKENDHQHVSAVDITGKRLTMLDSFIESNLAGPIKISHLAKYLFMSERNLCRFIKTHKGVSAHRYILQLRIKKAVELYTKSGLPLVDVACLTGFSSPFHLSRAIKNVTGKNPTEL
jgi:AraC-like DNA-binding protein